MVMATKTINIMDGLATMSPAELRDVVARAQFLLGGASPVDEAKQDVDERVVHDALEVALRGAGLTAMPYGATCKSRHYAAFRDGANEVLAYARQAAKPEDRRQLRRALQIIIDVVIEWCREYVGFASSKVVCQQLRRVRDIMDSAYPGYLEMGMISIVFREPEVLDLD